MSKYPIYVISKGRAALKAHTARFLINDDVDFKLVVEPQEHEAYAERFEERRILKLPFSNLGLGGIPARNWVWEHAKEAGHERHWILDDNIRCIYTRNGTMKRCNSHEAISAVERFIDKFANIAIGGLNYLFEGSGHKRPFILNCHVYSCLCIRNDLPFRWRGRYNEDTDLCLQALTNNYCTVNVNAYVIDKATTMTCKGGNMEELYQGNGRLKMARSLEYQWKDKYPNLVKTTWKFNRPQHSVKWSMFKTPLKFAENSNGTTI